MIQYDKFKMSLKHLELQYQNYKNIDKSLPEITKEAIGESVIQRFEICYDCMWKVLKRYLRDEIGISEVPSGPKPLARTADENKLLTSSLEKWFLYIDARIGTTHDYSGEKAKAALELMGDFIDDAIGLYQTMSGESWE